MVATVGPVSPALALEKGDALVFEIAEDGAVSVRKAVPLDEAYASALHSLLSEWDSAEDDEAYRGL